MSGISSSLGYYLVGKQASKGTLPVTWFKYRVCKAPSLEPEKVVNRYAMTDSSRDRGDAYTSVVRVKGDICTYLHPDGVALPFYLAMGSNADSGAGPNYTHTITPADDLPWFSIFRVVGNVVTEQFMDCKLDALKVEGEAGMAPEMTWSVLGITPTWEAVVPASTAIIGDPYKYWEGKNLLNIAGSPYPWSKFDWELRNGLGDGHQADDFFLNDIDPGKREIDFGFTMHFTGPTAEPKYREFIYGSDAGTTVGTGLVAKAFDWTLQRNANTSLKALMPQGRYAAIPVQPDPGGEPIECQVATVIERVVGGNIATITVKDQAATVG